MKIARLNNRSEAGRKRGDIDRKCGPISGLRSILSLVLSAVVLLCSPGIEGCRKEAAKPAAPAASTAQQQPPPTAYAALTPDQLYQLVSPIALFPDNLVAQVLAASTFPDQVAAADTWMQQNASLKGAQLMQAADQQPWDVSVKAMTQFPDVLHQMATSLAWTSSLGDAYFNEPQSVMNAIQVMRQRAQAAGNLKSTPQQTVSTQPSAPASAGPASSGAAQTTVVQAPPQTIVIQPAQPDVVYVPQYNPQVVYGQPVASPPGYSTGDMVATSLISFGLGVAVGAAINSGPCCGWGYHSWGCGWNNSTVVYNRNTYVSNSNTFANRNAYYNRAYNNRAYADNYNRANYNRANYANNRAYQNPNNRANNFNTNRPGATQTPQFNQRYNQPQYRNNQNLGGQTRANTPQQGGVRAGQQPVRAGNLNQAQNRPGNLSGQTQNRSGTPGGQTRNDPARGYGQQANRGNSNSAFGNYGEGGNARTNSARGQQSLGVNQPSGGVQRQQQAGGGGFGQGGGGQRAGGGGGGGFSRAEQSRPEGHGGRRR